MSMTRVLAATVSSSSRGVVGGVGQWLMGGGGVVAAAPLLRYVEVGGVGGQCTSGTLVGDGGEVKGGTLSEALV